MEGRTAPLVIGWGNPLRSDDGAGYRAAELLGGMAVQQLTPELAADLATADQAIFIDADATVTAGTWTAERLQPAAASESLTHSCTPAALLALARLLYGRTPAALLIRIGAAEFEHGAEISPAVDVAIDEVVRYARDSSKIF